MRIRGVLLNDGRGWQHHHERLLYDIGGIVDAALESKAPAPERSDGDSGASKARQAETGE